MDDAALGVEAADKLDTELRMQYILFEFKRSVPAESRPNLGVPENVAIVGPQKIQEISCAAISGDSGV